MKQYKNLALDDGLWIMVYNQSGRVDSTSKKIRFKTSMLPSDLCDYGDAYIIVIIIIHHYAYNYY